MAQQKTIELEVKTGKSEANLQDVVDAIKSLNKEVTKTSEQTSESLDNVEKQSKGIFKSIKSIGKGIKGVGLALKAAGFGLIVKAASALFDVLKTNQPVADAMSIAFEFLSQILNQVSRALIDTYNAVASSTENFDALLTVLKNVLNIGLAPLKLSFFGIKLGLQQAQLAWEQSFFGGNDAEKIKQLRADIILTKNDLYGVADGVIESGKAIYNNFSEAVSEISNIGTVAAENLSKVSITAALENSKTLVQLRKDAELARVANQGLIEEYDRQAEQQRQIRDDDTKSIAERIEANNKLADILEKQKTEMLENADIAIKLAQLDVQKNNSIENQVALQEALNEKKAIEAQITGFQSEQISNSIALQKEQLDLTQSITDADAERNILSQQFLAEQIQGDYLRLQALRQVADQEAEIEEERLLNKMSQYQAGTQAFIDAENELLAFQQESDQKKITLERDLQQAKQQLVTDALGNLASIVGQNSKFGKGIALVQAIRDTYAGANVALASAPPPFNFISAAAVIAGGIANVKQITATKEPQAPSFAKGSTGGSANISIPSPQAPNFNVVGTSGTNQLAETIAGKTNEPMKAYVVASDVTTAQSLERNIVSSASI
jgi:hypothetical protein